MTKEYFKEFCKHIIAEVLQGVPNGEELRIYRDPESRNDYTTEYFCIECADFKYVHYSSGKETFQVPGGLNDEN